MTTPTLDDATASAILAVQLAVALDKLLLSIKHYVADF